MGSRTIFLKENFDPCNYMDRMTLSSRKFSEKEGYYVYFICDSRENSFFFDGGRFSLPHTPIYVGKGKGRRYLTEKNLKFNFYIEEMRLSGHEPKIIILPFETELEAYEQEKFYIDSIGRKNISTGPLLNIHPGGKFNFGLTKGHSSWNKGLKHSRETIQKLSERAMGRKSAPVTIETCKKISDGVKKSWNDPVHKEKRIAIAKEAANRIIGKCPHCEKDVTPSTRGRHFDYCKKKEEIQ